MPVAGQPLLESFSALADPTRGRMLLLLDGQELTVSELCAVLQLPQSTVSRHLKTLADIDWVSSRRDGTSRYYTLALDGGGAHAQIWDVARRQWTGRSGSDLDRRRLARVLAQRSETSQQFFASAAGRWDHVRDELFGRDSALRAFVGLLPSSWVVADLGCGTGATLALLAPHVARVIGIDASDEMLKAAEQRLAPVFSNVELRRGSLESLPLESASVDAAIAMFVLHHLPSPSLALAEAARALKPGGRLLIVDMAPHDQEALRRQMGHVWLGFADNQLERWLQQAGFDDVRIVHLPVSTEAKGPALFLASASNRTSATETPATKKRSSRTPATRN